MKRRNFIKTTGTISALASIIPMTGFRSYLGDDISELQNFILQNYDAEQEESPSIVTDGKGNMWVFSLRRMGYPLDKESISAFYFNGGDWEEIEPVTASEGQYEAPVAACAQGGKPVVAWCEINSGNWQINVSALGKTGFEKPVKLKTNTGKPINPVLIAPDKNRNWIAWESYHKGKFSICISKSEKSGWTEPFQINKGINSCFDPAMAEAPNGDLYIAYGITDGYHQNIEMAIIDGSSMEIKDTIPVAIGGGFKNRVNLNTQPAIAFDKTGRLWISYENNRNATRIDDGDNYTGERCLAILSYQDGKIEESKQTGKWLFSGKHDHKPTFIKDFQGRLFLASSCGGSTWEYRLSWLDPENGWANPLTLLTTRQRGVMVPSALAFDKNNNLWFSTCIEKIFKHEEPAKHDGIVSSRLTQLMVQQFSSPNLNDEYLSLEFRETQVEEYHLNKDFIPETSGHPKIVGERLSVDGEDYTLVFGNLHEHSENSPCWGAGKDGTLHEEYRFGMFSEGYNFVAITDHGYGLYELYWRKNYRIADFYNDPPYFVALPAMEWTKTSGKVPNTIKSGAGHYNVVFASAGEARKFTRNRDEVYNVYTPETANAKFLWELLHEKQIDCITIPHHPHDEIHPVDWDVHDDEYVPVVEMFQCRGNAEYPGCPREINIFKQDPDRHRATKFKRAFVDYALREKKYKMGFVASGDHSGMGVGVAALWVKELSRDGILEAMRNRRCYATTGDKMIVDFRINGSITGSTIKTENVPTLNIKVKGQRELDKIEVLRNSAVIKEFKIADGSNVFNKVFNDESYKEETEVLYYYVRATQKNNEIAWSSPIWIQLT